MFEESMSIPAIWASMNSWFTPTVLFVFLNVMIGTIVVTSGLGTQKHQQKQTKEDPQQPHLARSPSVLQRLKSINLYHYTHRSQEPAAAAATTTFIPTPQTNTHHYTIHRSHEQDQTHEEEEQEEEEQNHEQEQVQEGEKSIEEVYSQLQYRHVSRTESDTKPASGEVPVKLPRKMKKSASAKSAFAHFEQDDIVETRRPATAREGKAKVTEVEGDDEEVDAKADDFINKFKHQLKLQRLDSIIRYKEMLTRGMGK